MNCYTEYQYRNEIMSAIERLVTYYCENHSKALVVRFDVRYPVEGNIYNVERNNKDISDCIHNVIKKYKRQGLDPYYFWVREQATSQYPHYHCFIILNAQKVRGYSHVFHTVEVCWGRTLGVNALGLINHCTDPNNPDYNGKILRRDAGPEAFQKKYEEVMDQLSYLAKAQTKAQDNDGMRNFGMSQLG